jgi:putative peptidoglycan lipid II flippase
MIPATIGASVYQLTIFIATLLASLLPSGSVSWLFYADRVAQFPMGIFSVALASVLLPALSTASATADTDGFRRRLGDSLRFTSFIIIPMAAGIWALALPITELLFERGAFTHESSIMTSYALKALAVGLWATSCHSMLVRAFIARKDTITPTLIGLCSLAVTVVVSLLLMGPIENPSGAIAAWLAEFQASLISTLGWSAQIGHRGLAAASSTAAFVSFALVLSLFAARIGNVPWRPFLASTGRALIASLAMVLALNALTEALPSAQTACLIGIPAGCVVYALVSVGIRSPELAETLAIGKRVMARATKQH